MGSFEHMSEQNHDVKTSGAAAKDPESWVTGDEPATASQLSYLQTLATDSGTEVPEQLSKADASRLIDELQDKSPRVDSGS
jgi:hypothetical protein